jgi:hypothetical protein
VAIFALLYVGIRELQPAYNRQFALRSNLLRNASMLHGDSPRVACYPQRWDSASFYLPYADIQVYRAEERERLVADLHSGTETLLIAKSGHLLRELLEDLPDSLEFVSCGHQGTVTIGCVRTRALTTAATVARRDTQVP